MACSRVIRFAREASSPRLRHDGQSCIFHGRVSARLTSGFAGKRQMQRKNRTRLRVGFHIDITSMRFNYRFNKAKPESKTPLRAAFVATIQPLPDALNFADRYTNPAVTNDQQRLVVVL